MTTLNDFNKTDLVDDHVAADVNNLIAAALRAEYANTETISATKELADSDTPFQVLTPSGADRTVELAPEATSNHVTVIYNPVGTSYNLVVKDDSGATTYATLDADEWALCVPIAGSVWKVQNFPVDATWGTITGTLADQTDLYNMLAGGYAGMVNGKLSVTVASNNLTVAIKTLAGTDPSSSDPVYVRIGSAVHAITSSLSVTKNAGTNWCNAGGAELATQEIDYFVYLGYNATDGVVIGFSRIPCGAQYDSFSTTTTNEKYCAISTITTAAATDPYDVVGRFAATLSAGAGYTWSVPTFTPSNLIHQPTATTRWLTWTPTRTGFSANPTATVYQYQVTDRTVNIIGRDGAAGTSNANTNHLTIPFSALSTTNAAYQFVCATNDNGTALTTPSYGAVYGTPDWKTIVIGKDFSFNNTGWTTSGDKRVRTITGFYQIV